MACTLCWFLESESSARVFMEMAQVNYCHVLQFQVILSIILTPRNWSQQRAVRELAAIFELIATVILSIILTAPHSEVLPKSLAGCWENYSYHSVQLLSCTSFWFLESESSERVSMEMAQVNSCHVFQFQLILGIILTLRNWS